MLMYNLVEYGYNYVETVESLWNYCRDDADDDNITNSESGFKSRFINNTGNAKTLNLEIAALLKCLSNFWRTLGMSCEVNQL